VDADGDEEDGDEREVEDGVDEDGEAAGVHAAELRHPAPARQRAEQPRREDHEQHRRHDHGAPVRHRSPSPSPSSFLVEKLQIYALLLSFFSLSETELRNEERRSSAPPASHGLLEEKRKASRGPLRGLRATWGPHSSLAGAGAGVVQPLRRGGQGRNPTVAAALLAQWGTRVRCERARRRTGSTWAPPAHVSVRTREAESAAGLGPFNGPIGCFFFLEIEVQ